MSFQQGVSGLTVAGRNLEVIGNNVANSSTVGAKKARAEFADLYATASGGGNGTNIGLGATLAAVSQQFSQGSINATDNPLDMAISGGGFFQLKDLNGSMQYSRAGQFKVDNQGNIVNNQGSKLLGLPADDSGAVAPGGQAQPLKISTKPGEPKATNQVSLEVNLDARTKSTIWPYPVDFADATTYDTSLPAQITTTKLDASGTAGPALVDVQYYFQKTSSIGNTATWNVYGKTGDGTILNADYSGAPQPIATLTYDTSASPATLKSGSPTTFNLPAVKDSVGDPVTPKTGIPFDVTTVASTFAADQANYTTSHRSIDLNKSSSYNGSTSVNVYDDKGQEVSVNYFFQKISSVGSVDQWEVYGSANGAVINPDAKGRPQPITTLTFDSSKPLGTPPAGATATFTVPATTSNTGSPTVPVPNVSLDLSGFTQYAASFAITKVDQSGYPSGTLSSLNIQPDGRLMATYTSGKSQAIGQVQLANFSNVQGLQPLGGNAWSATFASGLAVPGSPGTGNLGVLQGGAVEESNVDLTAELVNMMVAQRVYQANAQTIKTQDSVLQTMVNLR